MAGRFAGRALLETPAAPTVIHIHKLDRLENAVSSGQGRGEGGGTCGVAPSPPTLTPQHALSEIHITRGGEGAGNVLATWYT